MQSAKGRASPKESPPKACRPARQLKINPVERNPSSPASNTTVTARACKDSPKLLDRRSPRSPICEKRRPSKLSELESQISKLENDLKTVKDQLIASESLKKEAQADAEEVKKQLSDVSLKLEESEKQLSDLAVSNNAATATTLEENSQRDEELESKIEVLSKQQLDDAASLASVLEEIQRLKQQLSEVTESDESHSLVELQTLKNTLAETRSLADAMKHELEQVKESEAKARISVKQTLDQLEAAKVTINGLRSDAVASGQAYDAVVSELQQSRARVSFLESFADNLKTVSSDQCHTELETAKSEVRQLKSALEAFKERTEDERAEMSAQIRNAAEMSVQIKSQFSLREAELKDELKKAAAHIEELKGSLMDKETELQCISEENEALNSKLVKPNKDQELGVELSKVKADLIEKENELQNILEKNETLKLEIAELDAARAAEVDALAKVARVADQLEKAQAVAGEMEAELRRLKVQSDQWRKAAEAAASMLSPGSNGKYVDPTGPLPLSPFLDEYDDDSFKKKNGNGNVLKKIGVLWKKPQK